MPRLAALVLVLVLAGASPGCAFLSPDSHTLVVRNGMDAPVDVLVRVARDGDAEAAVAHNVTIPSGERQDFKLDLATGAAYVIYAESGGRAETWSVTAHSGTWWWTVHVQRDGLAFNELHGD